MKNLLRLALALVVVSSLSACATTKKKDCNKCPVDPKQVCGC